MKKTYQKLSLTSLEISLGTGLLEGSLPLDDAECTVQVYKDAFIDETTSGFGDLSFDK